MFSECVSECVWICYFFPTFNLLVYTYYLYAYLLIHTPFGEAHFVLEWKSNMVSEKKHLVIRTKVHHSKTHHNGLHSHTLEASQDARTCTFIVIDYGSLVIMMMMLMLMIRLSTTTTHTYHSAHRPHWFDRIEFQQLFWYPHSAIKIWWVHKHMTMSVRLPLWSCTFIFVVSLLTCK